MPPKLTPADIARTLEEIALFTQNNAANLAARNGTDMATPLQPNRVKEERRYWKFLHTHGLRFTDDHRRQLTDAFAHVVQARARHCDTCAVEAFES